MKHFFPKIMPLYLLTLVMVSGISASVVQNGCTADYIIVGLGTAGAPLARYLSNNNSVLVLEAGPNLATDPVVLSPDFAVALTMWNDPKYSLVRPASYGNFVPDVSGINAGFLPSPYTDGRMWGGSSAHNGLLAVRGSTDVYDQWASITGDADWSYSSMLNLMLFLEHYNPNGTAANVNQRGLTGPLFISQDPPVNSNTFVSALATAFAAPLVVDYNDPTNAGANPAPNYLNVGTSANQWFTTATPPAGQRSFSINAFLPTSVIDYNTGLGLNGRRLRVISSATASKVLFSGTKAIGVEYILDGNREQVFQVFANKEVILCAGAIPDAAILQRSGIGDPALLASLGIPVVVANPNVGANMQNHYGPVGVVALNALTMSPFILVETFFGISSPTIREIQSFFQRGILLFPQPEVLRQLGVNTSDPFLAPVVTIPFQLVKNASRGTVKIINTDVLTEPRVDFNLYSDGLFSTPGTDAANAVACYRKLLTIAGSSVIYPPAGDFASDAQLFADAQQEFLVQDHGAGTCRMSSSIANGVVNGNLQVFGTQGLRVADVSVEPVIETGNTAYTGFLIGLRAALKLGATLT